MNFNEQQTAQLVTALNVCKTMGIDSVVIGEGLIRGAKALSNDTVIISPLDIGMPDDILMGVGRVNELVKRVSVLSNVQIEATTNDRKMTTILNLKGGKTKMQYRCTSPNMIRYPKEMIDEPIANIYLSEDEVKHLCKTVNTMNAEHVSFQLTRQGNVVVEATDPATKDTLNIDLDAEGEILGAEKSFVFSYLAGQLVKILNSLSGKITLTIGQIGSITLEMNGHIVMVMPQLTDEDLGYDD